MAVDSDVVDRAADAPPPGARSGRAETPETLLLRDTLAPELQAAIDALPEAFREAVWLRDVEEFSYAEIAAMLDVPDRHGHVPHLARPAPAVRTVEPVRADRAQREALSESDDV